LASELIIDSGDSETVIALLQDRRLVELHREKSNKSFNVGDLYLGRVKKVMTGLNAAFVDVGYEKDAFLHYLDLGPQVLSFLKFTKTAREGKGNANLEYFSKERDIHKDGKISQVVQSGMPILVQIAKEPISSKGPRITTEISLAGRYVVLVPFSDKISVSQKIKEREEKDRLKNMVQAIVPANYGVIIRTVAENKSVADIHADLNDLLKKWETCYKEIKGAAPPQRVLGEIDRTNAILRDLLNEGFSAIHLNDQKMFDDLRDYLKTIAPEKEKILKLYKGDKPIFEHLGVDKQIKALFGRHVTMKSGGYLIVEHTEAMHVIDVNSGNRARSDNTQEANALEINLEAAVEIARQLRLRDMGGIIVVDFIDLHNPENRKKLFDRLKSEMKSDRAKHNILPPSKFGLVQITRQRVRPEMNVVTVEKCPACRGTGEVQPTVLLVDQIENNLRYVFKELNEKSVTLTVHPYLEAFLTKGIMSVRRKWSFKFGRKIKVRPSNAHHFLEYHLLNKDEEEIKI
jgi:ribonuclease G